MVILATQGGNCGIESIRSSLTMCASSSLLDALQNMLKRLERSPEFARGDSRVQELRRWLLITIADLEDRKGESIGSKLA